MSAERTGEMYATRAIIVIDERVLLGKRGRGSGEGQFALIGGKLDGKETPEETVIREVKEEVGLDFANPVLFIEKTNKGTKLEKAWHVYYFTGQTTGQLSIKEDEVPEVIYITESDLENIDIAFDHREILTKFFASR